MRKTIDITRTLVLYHSHALQRSNLQLSTRNQPHNPNLLPYHSSTNCILPRSTRNAHPDYLGTLFSFCPTCTIVPTRRIVPTRLNVQPAACYLLPLTCRAPRIYIQNGSCQPRDFCVSYLPIPDSSFPTAGHLHKTTRPVIPQRIPAVGSIRRQALFFSLFF